MASDREELAQKLREARENCGISQQTAAAHLGLSRSLVAQIELGNRPASVDELSKLATLYRRSVAEFSGEAEPNEDEVLVALLRIAPQLQGRDNKTRLQSFLALCREALALERAVARRPRSGPPHYDLPAPRNVAEAVAHGEQVAAQERRRLGLGAVPIGRMSDLISFQGVRTSASDLPDDVIGLFLRHRSVGPAILVNRGQTKVRQRFAFAHEYAHALFDKDRVVMVTKITNADELVEKRANAFAAAFLLPYAGVEEVLSGINKGQQSRRAQTVFDVATEDSILAGYSSGLGSQTLTYHDIATVAQWFGTSYQAAVYRLLALEMISDANGKDLLSQKRQRAAKEYLTLFGSKPEGKRPRVVEAEEGLELKAEIAHLAIEGYRRQVITKDQLGAIATKLQVPELTAAKFLELADAAR
jgi:Zn-dependent peptidase ImmA (M78 family)/transcriptional regulator with XRE-family HTH domain